MTELTQQKEEDFNISDDGNALIYCRVPKKKNDFELLNAQQENCLKFANENDINFLCSYWDTGNAKTLNRYGLNQIMKACRDKSNKIKFIIVDRLDVLTNQLSDFLQLRKELDDLGIAILSVMDPNEPGASGKFRQNIIIAISQFNFDRHSELVKAGLRKKQQL